METAPMCSNWVAPGFTKDRLGYGKDEQLPVLEGRELLVFQPPFTRESGVKTVELLNSIHYPREKKKNQGWI